MSAPRWDRPLVRPFDPEHPGALANVPRDLTAAYIGGNPNARCDAPGMGLADCLLMECVAIGVALLIGSVVRRWR